GVLRRRRSGLHLRVGNVSPEPFHAGRRVVHLRLFPVHPQAAHSGVGGRRSVVYGGGRQFRGGLRKHRARNRRRAPAGGDAGRPRARLRRGAERRAARRALGHPGLEGRQGRRLSGETADGAGTRVHSQVVGGGARVYSIVARTSPAATVAPSLAGTVATRPAREAFISFCIFMASTTTRP